MRKISGVNAVLLGVVGHKGSRGYFWQEGSIVSPQDGVAWNDSTRKASSEPTVVKELEDRDQLE
jgi:hypothetical protein